MFAAVMMPRAVPMGSTSPDRLPSMQMPSFASSPFRPSRPSPLSSSPARAASSSPPSASSQLDTQSSPVHSSQQQQQQQPIFGFSADAFNNSSSANIANTNNKLFRFASRPTKQVARGQQARDAAQQTRRSLFLRNVRQRADDRGWERRNFEQELQRMEYFSTEEEFRRAREAEAAELIASQELDEEYAFDMMDGDERIADLLAMEEEAELERLLALEREQAQHENPMLPEQPPLLSASGPPLSRQPSSVFYSDDGEYDDIFAELASAAENEDTEMDL